MVNGQTRRSPFNPPIQNGDRSLLSNLKPRSPLKHYIQDNIRDLFFIYVSII
ncbi:MAG: hypothetical protein ACKN9E_09235 [Microcystaceae cyanobacterium]